MLSFMATLVKSQLFTSIPYPTSDFSDQTIIVTGSNTGLGREAARHLVRLGASKVILGVRTVAKGEQAAKDIVESNQAPPSVVEVWPLDMSDRTSIKAFAKRARMLKRVDAAILNAGIMTAKATMYDGIEGHIAINVVGSILLATLLLPVLRRSASNAGSRGRLTIVGSDTMYIAPFEELRTDGRILDYLNKPQEAYPHTRYALSKLLVFYSVRELARRAPLRDSDVILTVLTPGACKSDLSRDEKGMVSAMIMAVAVTAIARTTEVGGRTLVHGVEPDLNPEAHGKFLMDCRIGTDGTYVDNVEGRAVAQKWNRELFDLLESIEPGCTELR